MKFLVLDLIKLYRTFISPFLPSSCIYNPTCSDYTMQAVDKYGAIHGSWMGIKRICRCHPFKKGGDDPVK